MLGHVSAFLTLLGRGWGKIWVPRGFEHIAGWLKRPGPIWERLCERRETGKASGRCREPSGGLKLDSVYTEEDELSSSSVFPVCKHSFEWFRHISETESDLRKSSSSQRQPN